MTVGASPVVISGNRKLRSILRTRSKSAPLLFQRVGPFATYPERVPVRLDLTSAPDVYAFVWTVTSSSSFRDQISGGNETALDPLHSSTRSPVRSASRSY